MEVVGPDKADVQGEGLFVGAVAGVGLSALIGCSAPLDLFSAPFSVSASFDISGVSGVCAVYFAYSSCVCLQHTTNSDFVGERVANRVRCVNGGAVTIVPVTPASLHTAGQVAIVDPLA